MTRLQNTIGRGAPVMDAIAPRLRPPLAMPRRLLRLRSDAFLAERFTAGDEAAFAMLYERHRASVLAVCMGVLGSKHDAEDAAQDAFAALAVSLREHPPRELRAWLARVARNAAIDVARRRRRTVSTDGEVQEIPAAPSGAKADLESVMAGIRELPESQRTALLMRELGGHSYAEIAALLESDQEAVRGLIARARMSLRTHREASELSCAAARATLAGEPDGGKGDKAVRRHVRGCAPCRAYKQALRDDARALRGIMPAPAAGVGGSGAIFGGLAAKSALVGGAMTQVTAACAVSACAVGGVVLLYPSPRPHRVVPAPSAHAAPRPVLTSAGRRASALAASAQTRRARSARGSATPGSGRTVAGRPSTARAARGPTRTGAQASSGTWRVTLTGSGSTSRHGYSSATGAPTATGFADPADPTSRTGSSSPTGPVGFPGAHGSSGAGGYGVPTGGSSTGFSAAGFAGAGGRPGAGSFPQTGTQAGNNYQGQGATAAAAGNGGARRHAATEDPSASASSLSFGAQPPANHTGRGSGG